MADTSTTSSPPNSKLSATPTSEVSSSSANPSFPTVSPSLSLFRHLLLTVLPPLSPFSRKGQHGRILIVGGCEFYTGAPFFAAQSALNIGSDLASIVCSESASIPIKCYSPDIMVRGMLRETEKEKEQAKEMEKREEKEKEKTKESNIHDGGSPSPSPSLPLNVYDNVRGDFLPSFLPLLSRHNSVVIGCGMGRDAMLQSQVKIIISEVIKVDFPLVIDGDAIELLMGIHSPSLLIGYQKCILTPNGGEFSRLWKSLIPTTKRTEESILHEEMVQMALRMKSDGQDGMIIPNDSLLAHDTFHLSLSLGGVTVLSKGFVDIISNGKIAVCVSTLGSMKRCGGQGDILAGMVGTAAYWAQMFWEKGKGNKKGKGENDNNNNDDHNQSVFPSSPSGSFSSSFSPSLLSFPPLCGAILGSLLTRFSSHFAFQKYGRGMVASHVVSECSLMIHRMEKEGSGSGREGIREEVRE